MFPSAVSFQRLLQIAAATLALAALGLHAADSPPAAALRAAICLNGEWQIAAASGDDQKIPDFGWKAARIPASPTFDPAVPARWHRLTLEIPADWSAPGRRFHLELEKVGHYAAVYCNGHKISEHWGQYTPFDTDVTDALRFGEKNEIVAYVHIASGKYVRPGAQITDPVVANAYRPAANQADHRNWLGIVGDVTLFWRPEVAIADVDVETSVRKKTLHVAYSFHDETGEHSLVVRSTVLDGRLSALTLPEDPFKSKIATGDSMTVPWQDPILWGCPPYGVPKLYTLRAELVNDGQVVDRTFTRFGFREVWIEGKDIMLNGKKLWMLGTYHSKLTALRDLNDRRPMAAMLRTMQAAGLNSLHGHWDDLGRPWLELCDEMGVFVLGGFFCDGRPLIQSRADDGWADWMDQTCAEWTRARRHHTSILLWRPTDVPPPEIQKFIEPDAFRAKLAATVRKNDPSGRPVADNSDVFAWGQSPETKQKSGEFDNFAPLQNAAASGKPFLNKEIYGGFLAPQKLSAFFRQFYQMSFDLGSSGMFVQQLPLLAGGPGEPFQVSWLSQSGPGNRDVTGLNPRGELPNWCDASHSPSTESVYAALFRDLYREHMGVALLPAPPTSSELLLTGLPPQSLVFVLPEDSALAPAQGMLSAADGTAWFVVLSTGKWRLWHDGKSQDIEVAVAADAAKPGYEHVQRVQVTH